MGANCGPLRTPRLPKKLLSAITGATGDSGTAMTEAGGYHKWAFQLTGTFTNQSVMIYATLDPAVLNADQMTINSTYPAPGAAGGAWFPVVAPSEQSGTGTVANPLTSITQILELKIPVLAVRAISTGTGQTGSMNCVAWAVD